MEPKKPTPRFTMFVKLAPGIISHFPGQRRVWCFRGDKFTDRQQHMIRGLINHFVNRAGQYSIVELYDNDRSREDPARVIFKYLDGVIVENRIDTYRPMFKGFPIPAILLQ